MAFTEIDHDVWVRSGAEEAEAEDLWPVDEAALADAARRYRHGRPVRVVGWACILACAWYAVWLGRAAASRDAMVAWGTMGLVAHPAKAPASPASASPLGADAPVMAAAVSPLPIVAAAVVTETPSLAAVSPLPTAAAAVVTAAGADTGTPDAGSLADLPSAAAVVVPTADAGVPDAGPLAGAPPRPKPAAAPKAAVARYRAARAPDPDDPYDDVVSSAAHPGPDPGPGPGPGLRSRGPLSSGRMTVTR